MALMMLCGQMNVRYSSRLIDASVVEKRERLQRINPGKNISIYVYSLHVTVIYLLYITIPLLLQGKTSSEGPCLGWNKCEGEHWDLHI